MALEDVVFPHEHLACSTHKVPAGLSMHAPSLSRGISIDEFEKMSGVVLQEEAAGATMYGAGATAWAMAVEEHRRPVSPPPAVAPTTTTAASGRSKASSAAATPRRPRRPKAVKNREVTESQRRNHIAAERNRRRQMNEYLAVLRSSMPPSYAQRGDQASVVAGAINFVKEQEQLLQSLEAQKRRCAQLPAFSQYSTGAGADGSGGDVESRRGARQGVEVAVAESHANVKVFAPRRPRQLLRMVVAMQCLGLTVLHLTATATADDLVFYSFSLKMEDECRLSSVDEIATAVHQMVAEMAEDRAS